MRTTCKKEIALRVVIDESFTDADRVAAAKKYALPERMEDAVSCQALHQLDGDNLAGIEAEIKITELRLRSGFSAFMVGAMAGADIIQTAVTVKNAGKVISEFPSRCLPCRAV